MTVGICAGPISESVSTIQTALYWKTGILASDQILTYAGKQLEAGKSLSDYCIKPNATLHLSLRLLGKGKEGGSAPNPTDSTRRQSSRRRTPSKRSLQSQQQQINLVEDAAEELSDDSM